MPGKHRIRAEQATLFVGGIRHRLSILALDGEEDAGGQEASTVLGVLGGGIYDAMMAHCGIRAKA